MAQMLDDIEKFCPEVWHEYWNDPENYSKITDPQDRWRKIVQKVDSKNKCWSEKEVCLYILSLFFFQKQLKGISSYTIHECVFALEKNPSKPRASEPGRIVSDL